ncbi:MAG: rRNA maturation RNase YbeY [Pirellulaceae bacterium]
MASLEIAINLLWESDVPRSDRLPSEDRIREAVLAAAAFRACDVGEIGVAIVDDAQIHRLNRQHLQHDYPTDVVSFPYGLAPPHVEGELVVSWDTALREADRIGWAADRELLLYVVHGTLHLVGMDDQQTSDRAAMRLAECAVLEQLGILDVQTFGPDRTDPPSDEVSLSR